MQVPELDAIKMIPFALSFLDEEAAEWARPHLKDIATDQASKFNNNWPTFITQFKE